MSSHDEEHRGRESRTETSTTTRRAYRSSTKSPSRNYEADEITVEALDRSTSGRRSNFETRMAMQRELDSARTQLRQSEREADSLRRQAVTSREDAASYRSENLRLAEELKSCRARLNSALDSQQELLRKNSEKHEKLMELQNQYAVLKDEGAVKTNRIGLLEEQLAEAQASLRQQQDEAFERNRHSDAKMSALNEDIAICREKLAATLTENDSLKAQVEVLRREVRLKEEVASQSQLRVDEAEAEISRLRDTVRDIDTKFIEVEQDSDRLSRELTATQERLEMYRSNEEALLKKLASRDSLLAKLQSEKTSREAELTAMKSRLDTQSKALQVKLDSQRQREKVLMDDIKNLQKFVGRNEASGRRGGCHGCSSTVTRCHEYATKTSTVAGAVPDRHYDYMSRSYHASTTSAPDRLRTYLDLAKEREEAERIAADARLRFRRSVRDL